MIFAKRRPAVKPPGLARTQEKIIEKNRRRPCCVRYRLRRRRHESIYLYYCYYYYYQTHAVFFFFPLELLFLYAVRVFIFTYIRICVLPRAYRTENRKIRQKPERSRRFLRGTLLLYALI